MLREGLHSIPSLHSAANWSRSRRRLLSISRGMKSAQKVELKCFYLEFSSIKSFCLHISQAPFQAIGWGKFFCFCGMAQWMAISARELIKKRIILQIWSHDVAWCCMCVLLCYSSWSFDTKIPNLQSATKNTSSTSPFLTSDICKSALVLNSCPGFFIDPKHVPNVNKSIGS